MTRNKDIKILVIDDEEMIRQVLSDSLADDGFTVQVAADGKAGLEKIREFNPNIVLLDIWMPGIDGIEVLSKARDLFPSVEIIMMSGHGTIETAVKATKMGAWDFVEKPLSMDKITILISNIIAFQNERGKKLALLDRLRKNIAIVGDSAPIKAVKEMVAKVAPADTPVLLTGPSGTGKELIAQNIHYSSPRAGNPFVEVNCGAIPEELMEREIFGYEEGAFTGASERKLGKVELADQGSVFFDEITTLPLDLQRKLLLLIDDGKIERVGGSAQVGVDSRIFAATSKEPSEEIKAGNLLEDLYHRINIISINLPALKDHVEDMPALSVHFSQSIAKRSGRVEKRFETAAFEELKKYDWPGNVRELRNFIERVYILSPDDKIDADVLTMAGLIAQNGSRLDIFTDFNSLREARASFEKQFIIKKLEENSGNISKTAEMIGVERSHLHRKIKAFGIDVRESEV